MSAPQRVAARHTQKRGAVAYGTISDAADQINEANEILRDAAGMLEHRGMGGAEAPADAIGEVARIVNTLRATGKVLGDSARALNRVVEHPVRGAAVPTTPGMDPKTRNRIAAAFNAAGLDGNGKFRKPEQGYVAAVETLSDFDIELDDIAHSFLFQQPSGKMNLNLAWTNQQDSFSPIPIPNSVLVLSWHQRESGNYEVLAYLS